MANRSFLPILGGLEKDIVILAGRCSIAADASVSASSGNGFTFTKTGTGEYTATLEDGYNELLAAVCTFEAAVAVNLDAQIKSVDVTSAKTVVIRTHATGSAANPSAVCALNLCLVLRNSSVN